MESWQPLPTAMAAGLVKCRWTKENPAPEAVVYLWVWTLLYQGASVSIRDAAEYAAWSRWKAEQILKRVKAERAAWLSKPDETGQRPDSHQTASPVIPDTSTPEPDSHQTATRRSRTRSSYTDTGKGTEDLKTLVSDKASQVWDKVNQIRKRHSPEARALKLTKARRAVLRARLDEHTEEEILRVVEWRESSPHSRAVFLRDGGHGVDTLLRASKFEGYLDASFGDQAPTIRRKDGLMDGMTAILKARESRLRKEAAAGGSTVVPFPHPIPNKEPF